VAQSRIDDAAGNTSGEASGPGAPPPGAPPGDEGRDEGLGETARRLYEEGETVARGVLRTLDALQSLAWHEAALARAALPQAALFAGIAVALGLAAWLYLMALLVAWLHLVLGWPGAMAVATTLSLLGAGACLWRCVALLKMTRFEATRRQLRELKHMLRQDPDPGRVPPDGAAGGAAAPSSGSAP